MTSTKIPERWRHKCDSCGIVSEHELQHRPEHWCQLILKRAATDFQGNAVGENNINRLVCADCTNLLVQAVYDVEERRLKDLYRETQLSDLSYL